MSTTRTGATSFFTRRSVRAALAAALIAPLAACYVVPVDPRTGQGYPIGRHDQPGPQQNPGPSPVTIVTPPASPAPPQPSVLNARLYPVNPQASKGGMLTAVVVDANTGRGSLSFSYLGDAMQGEATRVDSSYAAFGRVHTDVLGPAPRTWSGRRGIANAYGGKGVSVQCEYLITGPSMGTGACLFSDGAKYQMHFGS